MRSSDFFVGRKNKRVWKHKHETLKKMRFVSWFCRITVAKIRLNGRSSQSWLYDGACSGLGKNRAPAFHVICVNYTMLFIVACSVMLYIVFLLCFSLSVFPYVILCFFLLFLCYSLFFSFCHLLLCYSLFFYNSITFSFVILCFFLLLLC